MARAYSQDLRDRVLKAVAAGLSARQAAARYRVGIATANVWAPRRAPPKRDETSLGQVI